LSSSEVNSRTSKFNKIVQQLADAHHDKVLDWHSLSLEFIALFTPRTVGIAVGGSWKWCTDGLPRGANILLQDAIHDLQRNNVVEKTLSKQIETDAALTKHLHYHSKRVVLTANKQSHRELTYSIRRGYLAHDGLDMSAAMDTITKKSNYYCPFVKLPLLSHHLTIVCNDELQIMGHKQPIISSIHHNFDVDYFLSLLRNKQLLVLGDSVALQMFHALDCALGTRSDQNRSVDFGSESGAHYEAAVRYYPQYNATIRWCKSQMLLQLNLLFVPKSRCAESSKSDFIVVGIGAWFKPYFIQDKMHLSYEKHFEFSGNKLKENAESGRKMIQSFAPKAKIIWRLHPHGS
jgi:hypothetical protein